MRRTADPLEEAASYFVPCGALGNKYFATRQDSGFGAAIVPSPVYVAHTRRMAQAARYR